MHIQFFLSSRAMTDFLVFLLLIFIALLFFIIYIICLIVLLLLLFFFLFLIFLHNSKKKEVKWKKIIYYYITSLLLYFYKYATKGAEYHLFLWHLENKMRYVCKSILFPTLDWTGLRIGLSAMSLVRPFAQLHSISFQRYSQNCSFLLSSFESQLRVWANQ